MDWLLENFGKLLPVVLMLLYFLLNRGKKKEGEEGAEDAEESERVRRIQEEIRRRILERQRGESPRPAVERPVLVEEPPLHSPQGLGRSFHEEITEPEPFLNPGWDQQEAEARQVLEQQAKLAERLEEARRLAVVRDRVAVNRGQAVPIKKARKFKGTQTVRGPVNPLRHLLQKDLSTTGGLRRAILLREVLGEPVGMRRDSTFQR